MSLASDYAAAVAAATAGAPPKLVGLNATFEVSPTGNLLVTRTSTLPLEASPTQALIVANWIITNFT
jgi:hypothetical protein